MRNGGQFVTTSGVHWMPMWSVDSWALPVLVSEIRLPYMQWLIFFLFHTVYIPGRHSYFMNGAKCTLSKIIIFTNSFQLLITFTTNFQSIIYHEWPLHEIREI